MAQHFTAIITPLVQTFIEFASTPKSDMPAVFKTFGHIIMQIQ